MCESQESQKYCLPVCSHLVQVHRMCSTVKTHLQCLHARAKKNYNVQQHHLTANTVNVNSVTTMLLTA